MKAQQQALTKVKAITISQQYGSDGYTMAVRLAFRLQWQLADSDLSMQVARQLALTEEESSLYDEHAFGLIDRFLFSLLHTTPEIIEPSATSPSMIFPLSLRAQERLYRETLQQAVEATARVGNKVIIGHAAQVFLANQLDVLHIRVVAPFEKRVRSVMQSEQLNEPDARVYIQQKDKQCAYYLRSQYHRDIDDPLLYDLVLNSHTLDVESQVDLIRLALEQKAHRLTYSS